jgi:uncharacterized protein (TIGR02594 family)
MIIPIWYAIANKEIGQKEIKGQENNPRIVEYHSTTTLKATNDEVPYCSSFVNWCLKQVGIIGTNSAAAISWNNWGYEIKEPKTGCIVVITRKSDNPNSAHVGFFVSKNHDYIFILGANQKDSVCIMPFKSDRLISYRWPFK